MDSILRRVNIMKLKKKKSKSGKFKDDSLTEAYIFNDGCLKSTIAIG